MSSSSSSKRLAVVVAAGHHATATASDPNNQQMSLKSSANRSTHVNLILASFFLGSVLVVSCICMCMNYCCKSKMRRRYSSTQGKVLQIPPDSPNLESSIYTLQGDCPYRTQYCDAPVPPPYRRPPTPGPPPAYDSVVSKSSKYRKFGENDEYSDEEVKLNEKDEIQYCVMSEVCESMNRLDKLRHCKFQGNCSFYTTDEPNNAAVGILKESDHNGTELSDSHETTNTKVNNDIVKDDTMNVIITINEGQGDKYINKIDHRNNEESCCHQNLVGENVNNEVNTTSDERRSVMQLRVNCDYVSEAHCSSSPGNSQTADITSTAVRESEDAEDQVLPSYEDALVMATINMKK